MLHRWFVGALPLENEFQLNCYGQAFSGHEATDKLPVCSHPDTPTFTLMRILVIEDEPDLARHIAAALTRQGHTTSDRKDGLEGLNTALDTRPDLIVLDVNLPTLDGFAVLTRLRLQHVDSRVIILTARGDVESRVKGLTSGVDDSLAETDVDGDGRRNDDPDEHDDDGDGTEDR